MASLRVQIDEWASSELGTYAKELARKLHREDALQDTLTEWLEENGGQLSPYQDIRALHAVLLKATTNCQKDIYKRDSARGRWEARNWEEKWTAPSLPARTKNPAADVERPQAKDERPQTKDERRQAGEKRREEERREKELRQEAARDLFLEMYERLEPLEQIVTLVNQEISGSYVRSNMSSSRQTLACDPEMLGRIQAAAARLEPPVSESEVCTWRHLEDVARSLALPSATLRSKKRRALLKLRHFLEGRGISFEHWNNFAFDD